MHRSVALVEEAGLGPYVKVALTLAKGKRHILGTASPALGCVTLQDRSRFVDTGTHTRRVRSHDHATRRPASRRPMLRLPFLAAAALLLPHVGTKPTTVVEGPASVSRVTAAGFPGLHIPNFLRNKRRRGVELEITAMKSRLRDLVVQQEAYYAHNKSYARNANRVSGVTLGDSTANGVQIQILFASSKAWTAVASHVNAPGRSCVAYVGQAEAIPLIPRTRLEGNSATAEGLPVCDSAK